MVSPQFILIMLKKEKKKTEGEKRTEKKKRGEKKSFTAYW